MAQRVLYEPLTAREREVLALIAQGLSDREIGERLFVARSTVKWFNRQIFRKLGVENRKEALQRAAEFGLLDAPDAPKTEPKHNLPAAVTPFIGRSEELDDLRRLLSHPHTRLVTVLAPGGMGKTRLALEAAESVQGQYADGVYFAALAGLSDSSQVISAVADALGFQFMPDGRAQEQQIADFLRRKHLLLLLDNFEHLLDAAPLVSEVLAAAPQVKMLVTSRERLNLTGEVVYALVGLRYPDAGADDSLRYGAVELFIESALRANPHFAADDTESVARICRVAQGMPLAIELAAAWAGMLSVREIADEISRSADFLKTSMRDVPERQRSVRAVFEAAWARLDEDTRRAFRWLSVFRGGCTREAAQAVTGASVATLASLVDRALLWRSPQTGRYDIHELLRQYAEGELEKSGEGEAARQAHQDYYASLTAKWGEAIMHGRQLEAFAILDSDFENVRRALARAVERGIAEEIDPFTELTWYYDRRSLLRELLDTFQAAADRLEPDDSVTLGKLLIGQTVYYMRFDLPHQMADVARRSMEMLGRLGAQGPLALATVRYAIALGDLGQHENSEYFWMEGRRLAEASGEDSTAAIAVLNLGNRAATLGQRDAAKAYFAEAIRLCARAENYFILCHPLNSGGWNAIMLGDLDEAERMFTEVLKVARLIGFNLHVEGAHVGLCQVALERGDWETAYHYAGLITGIQHSAGWPESHVLHGFMLLGKVMLLWGKADEARRWLREGIPYLDQQGGQSFSLWMILVGAALIRAGEHQHAAACLSPYLANPNNDDMAPSDLRLFEETLAACRAALTPEEIDAAVARGRTLTPEAAIAEVMPFL
ncbi:MAG: hypothetical protein IPK52_22665 [Chloroflexi bacterium]|nr:hypothetical protein [Chloroflexota bacterium]